MVALLWFRIWNALNYIYGFFQFKSRRQLRSFKGAYAGKRCFVVGNGPSLRTDDLRLLHERGEFTFACNALIKLFDEIPFRPTFYFVQDNKIILDNKEEIKRYDGVKFIKAHYAKRYHIDNAVYYSMLFPQNPIGFSLDLSRVVYSGQTVTYSMIQFAVYMGFTEIYIIGVDCDYSPKNEIITAESYFDKRLFNGSRAYSPPEVGTNLSAFARAREVCDMKNVKIFNASRGGKLEVFPRVDFDKVL